MWDVLKTAMRSGVKTSEFFVVVLAIFAPVLLGLMDKLFGLVEPIAGGPETFMGGLVAAVYVFVRGWVKASSTKAVVTETGNRASAGLGSASAEAEYRRAHTPLAER